METPRLAEDVTTIAVMVGGSADGLERTFRGEPGPRYRIRLGEDGEPTDYLFVGIVDGRAIYSCLPGAA